MPPAILYVKVSRNSVMNDCVSGYSPLQLKSNSHNNNKLHKKDNVGWGFKQRI